MEFHEFFFEVRRKVKHEEEERRYFSVVKNKEDEEGVGKWREKEGGENYRCNLYRFLGRERAEP